jgi:hypothetical protein
MTRDELLAREAASWAALWALVDDLDEDAWLTPGAAGDEWTLKNVMAHISSWQEETLTVLPDMARQVVAGVKEPRRYDIDAWNDEQYRARRHLPVDVVRDTLLATRTELLAMIERIPEEWLSEYRHITNWIVAVTDHHYDAHAEMLRAWRATLGQ